jgi:hypothetical protein
MFLSEIDRQCNANSKHNFVLKDCARRNKKMSKRIFETGSHYIRKSMVVGIKNSASWVE